MRHLSTTSIFALSVGIFANGGATAQGLGPQLYFGGGFERGSSSFSETFDFDAGEPKSSSRAFGVFGLAGYRAIAGSYFYAGEVDFSIPFSGSVKNTDGNRIECGSATGVCGVNWTSRQRILTGITVGGHDYFAAVGSAIQNVDFTDFDGQSTETVVGLSVGVGGQFALRNNWDLRVEVIHDMYEREFSGVVDGKVPFNANGKSKWENTTVRAAAIFEF